MPTLLLKVLMPPLLWVYAPVDVIPVVAVIAPAVLTVNALFPTDNRADGVHVPIPTFPLVTTKAPCVADVPIPTLPKLVS